MQAIATSDSQLIAYGINNTRSNREKNLGEALRHKSFRGFLDFKHVYLFNESETFCTVRLPRQRP